MLYFLSFLVVGVLALLALQKADIECVNPHPVQIPPLTPVAVRPAAKRQEDRSRKLPLGQLAEQ